MALPPYRLDPPDGSYSIPPEEREKIRTGFDPVALERLLAMLVPECRPDILNSFQWSPRGESAPNVVSLNDPELNAVLDEVWLPMWEKEIPESIEDETKEFPGLALARRRRAEGLN